MKPKDKIKLELNVNGLQHPVQNHFMTSQNPPTNFQNIFQRPTKP